MADEPEVDAPEVLTPRRRFHLRPRLGLWPCYVGWHWGQFCWFCMVPKAEAEMEAEYQIQQMSQDRER